MKAMLDTGSGKTLIAIMLIKEVGQVIKTSGIKKLIVYLDTTVHLVNQQLKNSTLVYIALTLITLSLVNLKFSISFIRITTIKVLLEPISNTAIVFLPHLIRQPIFLQTALMVLEPITWPVDQFSNLTGKWVWFSK